MDHPRALLGRKARPNKPWTVILSTPLDAAKFEQKPVGGTCVRPLAYPRGFIAQTGYTGCLV